MDSSKEFEHIGVDLAQGSDVQMVMVDGEQYILLAHHHRASQELVRATLEGILAKGYDDFSKTYSPDEVLEAVFRATRNPNLGDTNGK